MESQSIVIVGAGQAGGWAAKTLRDRGFAGRVVLLGDEAHPPYERPPLSKGVLAGQVEPRSTHLFKDEVFGRLALELCLSTSIMAIDPTRHIVTMDRGDAVSYDKLILCTGGRPRALSVEGADLPGIYTLRSIDDALAIRDALAAATKVAVVGGGWIGLEVAAAARAHGTEVSVIEAAPRLCVRSVPPEISGLLHELHTSHGTQVLLNCGVTRIARTVDGHLKMELTAGQPLVVDAIVVGVGLIANDDLARAAGIKCENGILVDETCRSSDPDIYAAGDVAVGSNRWAGERMRLESWQNAQNQGIAAASAALGFPVCYDPLPWFWSDQFTVNIQIYGVPKSHHRVAIRRLLATQTSLYFYLEQDRLKAVVGVNAPRELAMARRLIEKQTAVMAEVLEDPDQSIPRA